MCRINSDSKAVQNQSPIPNEPAAPVDCCGGLNNVDYSKMDFTLMEEFLRHINFYDTSFCVALIAIIFNPFFWNLVARWEHRTRRLSGLFGSPFLACYCLGFIIILLNVLRSHSMTVAMKAQPRWEAMDRMDVFYVGTALIIVGTVLVVSSFLALGFTGTFLGDYFGILLDEKVTVFPFNIMENPMYWGSTANYLGLALIGASPVGLILTATVAAAYKVAIQFEGPFTAQIYRERSQRRKHE
ncbi:phosphatidylethanolamine N-methyltransferase isoform X1 [Takifugu rubripes]|uniref:Phosphatidylethanolamine N-methyltransferase n=1 Tax=Takifugu rubripes TaxID=31033 RepID=H2V443_TAKRU|nr:phosphatidylethanolamine N-methyltransferase isoform X1 [Takifugu rubripes]XP_056901385.1 phosphatidylethanolamine N-methyltransferase isoform X1 [Takifugu flavidus]|eukprot:XP_011603501.1 PREDICTED: phosphatidylethanolamine N-methyltransferase isoform X1 [Takifugu rubripes]